MDLKNTLKKIKEFVKENIVLLIAVFLATVTSFFYKSDWDCIDVDVLLLLFSLMLVVSLFKSFRCLDWLAIKLLQYCRSFRSISFVLTVITFFSSMFVTNDVALITFVPLALIIGKDIRQDMVRPIIFMTLAANLGSMLTPQGNPQNLFLFNFFHYSVFAFLKVMALPVLLSVFYIAVLLWHLSNAKAEVHLDECVELDKKMTMLSLFLLLMNIVAVLHYVEKLPVVCLTLLVVVVVNWRLLLHIDYGLLLTFVGFFVFIGNVQHTDFVYYLKNSFLGTELGTYLVAVIFSQFISNVPTAMLLAGLTNQADALLTGVNVGGMGTLIASMASVISYQFFVEEHPYQALKYLQSFSFYNFCGLFIIGVLTYLFL